MTTKLSTFGFERYRLPKLDFLASNVPASDPSKGAIALEDSVARDT
jgi:hypothetical protein